MPCAGRTARQRGGGKFEFLVVVAVAGVLGAALLDRLDGLEQEGERAEVDLTVRNIRVGLRLAVGERLMRGEEGRLPELLAANPVAFLGREPRGYAADAARATLPGSWHFDAASGVLAYRPRRPEAFGGRRELRWRMASQGGAAGRIVGIRLESAPN